MKAPIAVVEPAFFLLMFAFGMIQPAGTSIVLDCERDNAGAASAGARRVGFPYGRYRFAVGWHRRRLRRLRRRGSAGRGVDGRLHPLCLSALACGVSLGWSEAFYVFSPCRKRLRQG